MASVIPRLRTHQPSNIINDGEPRVPSPKIAETIVGGDVNPADPVSTSELGTSKYIIIVFAIIIIALIVLILVLICKKDSIVGWMRGEQPEDKSAERRAEMAKQLARPSHTSIVNNTSDEELEKYANPVAQSPKIQTVNTPVPEPEPADEDDIDEPEAAKPEILNIDKQIEKSLSNTLDKLSVLDAEPSPVFKTDEKPFRTIEQLALKGDTVIKTFSNVDDVYSSNFDYDNVISCCKGTQKTHKNYRWRFAQI